MKIVPEMLVSIWYEDRQGNKYYPTQDDNPSTIDSSFCYQFSRFPHMLQTNMLYIVDPEVVENCEHPKNELIITYNYNENTKTKKCLNCHGSKTYSIDDENFEDDNELKALGSVKFMTSNCGWSEDLVLAMYNSKDYTLNQAIIISSTACERCLNALAHKYGLSWGYAEYSNEWKETNTKCEFCKE